MGCSSVYDVNKGNAHMSEGHSNRNSYIWMEYIAHVKKEKKVEHNEHHQITFNNKIMEYCYTIKGDAPCEGYSLYIALHDGEASHSAYNTNEYKKMKTLYLPNIANGIYLAIRGISDQSNLHYMNESYIMIDMIIREMIALHNANPNKVYLLGVGLGGDAVYQIASKLNDRFSALSINSGHSYGLNLKNLLGIPILIQVGEHDIAYEKNKNSINVYTTLLQLHKEYNIPITNIQCNIHINKSKHIIDYHPYKKFQPIVKDPLQWLIPHHSDIAYVHHNVNAIEFVSQFQRNPFPRKLIWDLTTCDECAYMHMKRRSLCCYWLEIGGKMLKEIGVTEIIASYDKDANEICVESKVKYVRVLVCEEMVDIEREVVVKVGGCWRGNVKVERNFKTERRCLIERGDYNFVFRAAIEIEWVEGNNYKVEQYEEE